MPFARIRDETRSMGTAPVMLSPEAAAKELGITPAQLDALARAALLSTSIVDGERLVAASEVARFKAGRPPG